MKQTQAALYKGLVDTDIEKRVERVWLQVAADQEFSSSAAQAPAWVHVDHEGTGLKEMIVTKSASELLAQARSSTDTLGRQWAPGKLGRLVKEPGMAAPLRPALLATLHGITSSAAGRTNWRVRHNALLQLRGLLAAADPTKAWRLDEANDIFSIVLLLATEGGASVREVFASLRQRWAKDSEAMKALEPYEEQLHERPAAK